MHPILADPRRLLWYLSAWLAAGAGMAALLRLADQASSYHSSLRGSARNGCISS